MMGDTPKAQMARAPTMGIQQLERLIFALLARLKVGTAIKATTAGRIPRKMAGRTNPAEDGCHHLVVFKLLEEHGNDQDDEERGQGSGQSRTRCSFSFMQLIADESADVDGEDAGTALGNGNQVEQLLLLHPLVLLCHLGLDNRNHGIAAAEGDHANLKECLEKIY